MEQPQRDRENRNRRRAQRHVQQNPKSFKPTAILAVRLLIHQARPFKEKSDRWFCRESHVNHAVSWHAGSNTVKKTTWRMRRIVMLESPHSPSGFLDSVAARVPGYRVI